MKPQAASQQQDGVSGAAAGMATARSAQQSLTEEQLRVLECLKKAGSGLTARQIESRSACDGAALQAVLETLLERKLVTRLNTIIPSYSARDVSPPINDR